MTDPSPEQIATLDPAIAWRAVALINALRQAGVPAIIGPLGARRSQAQQLALYNSGTGVTATTRSLHVTGKAFDIDIAGYNRDAVPPWFWNLVGPWAESRLGLTWGGRWTRPYDPGHFQLDG